MQVEKDNYLCINPFSCQRCLPLEVVPGPEKGLAKSVEQAKNHEKSHAVRGQEIKWEISIVMAHSELQDVIRQPHNFLRRLQHYCRR
jgi:hypothetical protein